ncbi:MAG: FAD-dependent oxidoreductase, partial [Bacteroidia bacterium]
MEKYDLVVIGGGPAGYAGAMRAIDFKKKVLLVEKNRIGGAGVYDGVLTSKTLWELSQKVTSIREMSPDFVPNFDEINKTVKEAIFERKTQMTVHLKLLESVMENQQFRYEKGHASFIDKHIIQIKKEDGSTKQVYAENVLIATGSRPRYLPHIPIDEKIIMTSNGIRNLTSFPKSMVVLGAGVIGCEFATIFAGFGLTKVYLIDKAERILPFEDEDVAEVISTSLESHGATIHSGASLKRM